MVGYIHSEESFGTVDGPGIRYVLFMQGCPLRCKYCHNPDTWQTDVGRAITVDEVLEKYEKNKSFYSKGGITVTGGEPLLQIDFVTELFAAAKKAGIHTCLDTSGITYNAQKNERFDALLQSTDLVMLDIKHIDPKEHKKLTGADNAPVLAFARHLSDKNIPIWIRHVIVPGITDQPEYLIRLGRFIGTLQSLKALDVIPYHTMGVIKYKNLGLKYPLEGVPALDKAQAVTAKQYIMQGLRESRSK